MKAPKPPRMKTPAHPLFQRPEMMLPQELIRKKRDGQSLTRDEVKDFIAGLTTGEISEGQVAAFAMAVFFNGMEPQEAVGLTLAMRDSGTVLTGICPAPWWTSIQPAASATMSP